jgi:hypothetical protein
LLLLPGKLHVVDEVGIGTARASSALLGRRFLIAAQGGVPGIFWRRLFPRWRLHLGSGLPHLFPYAGQVPMPSNAVSRLEARTSIFREKRRRPRNARFACAHRSHCTQGSSIKKWPHGNLQSFPGSGGPDLRDHEISLDSAALRSGKELGRAAYETVATLSSTGGKTCATALMNSVSRTGLVT